MVRLVEDMTRDHPARPVLVLSNAPEAAGLAKAADIGIPTAVVDRKDYKGDRDAFDTAVGAVLETYQPDVVCLAGFMRILTPEFTQRWAGRMLNIHPSLLPKYSGLNTHARALKAGDADHGCTVHEVTPALDDGPILGQARCRIEPEDTPKTLAARVLPLEHKLYPAVLARFIRGDSSPVFLDG